MVLGLLRSSHLRPLCKAGKSGRGRVLGGVSLHIRLGHLSPDPQAELDCFPHPNMGRQLQCYKSLSPAIHQLMEVPCAASRRAWILN